MAVTIECALEVPISAFHAAVKAVLPHADKPRLGDDPAVSLARVRVVAAEDELLMAATNGRTSALAAVEIIADSRRERFPIDDGALIADIHPTMLRDLHGGLTAQRVDGDLLGEARIAFTGPASSDGQPGKVTVTDIGGLWLGAETARPLLPDDESFPDIVGLLSKALGAAAGVYKPLVTDDLAAFTAASKAYGHPLQVEPVGTAEQRGWIVLCGPDFAGSIAGGHHDDNSLQRRDSWRRKHLGRFGLGLISVG